MDNYYKGGIAGLEFVPATRLDYKINETWTVAAEEYDDFGQLRRFLPASEQFHEFWATVDYNGDPISIETGVGFGLTPATDDLTVKLMFMSDLTGRTGCSRKSSASRRPAPACARPAGCHRYARGCAHIADRFSYRPRRLRRHRANATSRVMVPSGPSAMPIVPVARQSDCNAAAAAGGDSSNGTSRQQIPAGDHDDRVVR